MNMLSALAWWMYLDWNKRGETAIFKDINNLDNTSTKI